MSRVREIVLNLPLSISKRPHLCSNLKTAITKVVLSINSNIKRKIRSKVKKRADSNNKTINARIPTTGSNRIRDIATKKEQVTSSKITKEVSMAAISREAQDSKTAKKVVEKVKEANIEESFNKGNHSFRDQNPIGLRSTFQLTIGYTMKETLSFTLMS